ncbi:MAG: hypothetical protein K2O16_05130 [Lachnospiraceae bacterium]|nr:hypothetical protein [Lachnospiraceae bacterium]
MKNVMLWSSVLGRFVMCVPLLTHDAEDGTRQRKIFFEHPAEESRAER